MRLSVFIIALLMMCSFSTQDDDAVVISRLQKIENQVPLTYNKHVAAYILVYGERKRGQTEKMLALSKHYFPIFERVLAENGLPEELKYLAIIESALNPNAVSRAGAAGLWQFMYSTAREYRLTINQLVDERMDTEKSTVAAANYLKRSYARYGDWLMAIASYNCGMGNVNKAIRRAGGSKDFWAVYRYLPRETRGYVPAFIGAMYVMEHADLLGLEPNDEGTEYLAYREVNFRKDLFMEDLTEQLDLDKHLMRKANASLMGEVIPNDYQLKLPLSKHTDFYAITDTLYALASVKIEEYKKRKKKRTYGPVQRLIPDDPNLESILYTIKEGDNIGFISYWYDAPLEELKAWNGMRRNKIVIDQELLIYVPKEKVSFYSRFDKLTNRQKNILSSDREERMLYAQRSDDHYIYHKVESGETFSAIVSKYPGATVEMIRELNNVDDRALKPGMYLKIMKNV